MAKAKRMERLDISQVAGVDHPAHLEEGWMVMKAAGDEIDPEVAKALTAGALVAKAGRKLSAPRLARLRQASEELAGLIAEVDPEEEPVGDLTKTADTEAEAKAKADAEAEATAKAAAEATAKAAGTGDQDEMLKSLPEPLRKRFSEMETALASQSEELTKERERRADETHVAKAVGWKHLPGIVPAEFGPALRKVAEAAPEQYPAIEKALSDANEAIATGSLFKEYGGGGTAPSSSSEPYGQLEAMAKARSTEKNEPFAIAFDAVTQTVEGKALLDQHNAQIREAR